MAITKTRSVQRIEVHPAMEDGDERVMVVYENTFDDSEDDELPLVQTQVKHLEKTVTDNSDPENPVVTNTDISGENALVQTVCNAVWS
jgi:hypothetical protein